jgi:hypothetical protein
MTWEDMAQKLRSRAPTNLKEFIPIKKRIMKSLERHRKNCQI